MPDHSHDSASRQPVSRDSDPPAASPQIPSSGASAVATPASTAEAVWLGMGFVLAGIGTALLGPLLPWLSKAWGLSDAQGGILLALKFSGAFLGGFSVPRKLRVGIFLGALLCCAGFGLFALSGGLLAGGLGLFVGGLGLGQVIASTNILVGRRYPGHTGSALALLNVFWSLGATITGLLAALLLPRFGMRDPLLIFATCFLLIGAAGAYSFQRSASEAELASEGAASTPLLPGEFTHFALLLFLYGGLETSLSGWLTTYTLRFSDTRWMGGQSAVVLLWTALTAGRALTSLLMRVFTETHVRAAGLVVSLFALVGLLASSRGVSQLACCVVLGLSLAPFFPATFARLMRHTPSGRMAGLILAVSGIGAALFPWLVGVLSVASGSLRLALLIPLALTAALLLVASFEPAVRARLASPGTTKAARFSTPV